jgi:hypothetical protein
VKSAWSAHAVGNWAVKAYPGSSACLANRKPLRPDGKVSQAPRLPLAGKESETTLLKPDTIPVCYVSPGTVLGKLDA